MRHTVVCHAKIILLLLICVDEFGDAALGHELYKGSALGPVFPLGPPLHQVGDEFQLCPSRLI